MRVRTSSPFFWKPSPIVSCAPRGSLRPAGRGVNERVRRRRGPATARGAVDMRARALLASAPTSRTAGAGRASEGTIMAGDRLTTLALAAAALVHFGGGPLMGAER